MTSSTSVMRINEGLGVAGAELRGAEEDEDYGVSCEDGELTQAENMCGGRRPLVAVVMDGALPQGIQRAGLGQAGSFAGVNGWHL